MKKNGKIKKEKGKKTMMHKGRKKEVKKVVQDEYSDENQDDFQKQTINQKLFCQKWDSNPRLHSETRTLYYTSHVTW